MNDSQAELCGMHAGDGTLYHTNHKSIVWELRGGLDETGYYNQFVVPLIQKMFSVTLKPKHRSGGGHGSYGVQTCNKSIITFLLQYFPTGEKSSQVRVPPIIFRSSKKVQSAFLRGLFDTDGCIRFDKNHTSRHYYPKIEFGTASRDLRDDVCMLLQQLAIGYYTWDEPKRRNYRICVPGKTNLSKWMRLIASHNPKHLNKLLRSEK